MNTVLFLTASRGVLGEEALARQLERAFRRHDGQTAWRFISDSDDAGSALTAETAAILITVPTMNGLLWAQRRKNELVLRGLPAVRVAALVLFAKEGGAMPLSLMKDALGCATFSVGVSLARLFSAHNDDLGDEADVDGLSKAATEIRAQFDAAPVSASPADIPWRSVEQEVLQSVWASDAVAAAGASSDELIERVRSRTAECVARRKLAVADPSLLHQLERRVIDRVTGLGPLEPLLRDPDVNEIMIVGTNRLFVEKQGRMTRVPPAFDHEAHLKTLIERIVAPSGRRVDWAAPFCDVRLKDGSRVNIVLPPLAVDGPCVTIRRFRAGFASLENLLEAGTVDRVQAERLQCAVRERRNIVIAGNTGAGKTTMMNVLASMIPETERILTLEDAAELSIDKPHVVRMETRAANSEGKGQITMRELVVNALRMRPDRLLVGECRGDEVIPMLQAMNTGHDGSMTTLHANSAEEVAPRLESLVSMSAPGWSLELIRQQIRSAFDVVVYMKRDGALRTVTEIRDVV